MIDVSKFVNSKDILRYWEETDCIKDFTPIQLAYIVYQSRWATLKEKQDKYKEIAKYRVRSVMVTPHAWDVVSPFKSDAFGQMKYR